MTIEPRALLSPGTVFFAGSQCLEGAPVKVLREGQCLRHALYGIGIATESNVDRTTIDFYEHGVKKFVTGLLDAELLSESPPRPPKARTPKAAGSSPKSRANR